VNDGGRAGGLLHLGRFSIIAQPTEMPGDAVERADKLTRPSRTSSGRLIGLRRKWGVRNVVSRRQNLGFQFLAHASRISNLFDDALQSLAGESKVREHVAISKSKPEGLSGNLP
jgi:hypothetical protein